MGTDNVREWVGFEKIKRIETEAKQNKAFRSWYGSKMFMWANADQKLLQKARKKIAQEIMRREVRRRRMTAEDLELKRGGNPRGDIG